MQENIVGFRLSPQQERIWLLQQAEPSLPYWAKCAVSIDGTLDQQILKASFQDAVARNEILRTHFRGVSEVMLPVQVVNDRGAVSFDEYNLIDCSSTDQAAKIDELFRDAGRAPLAVDEQLYPPVALIAVSPDRHIMIIALPALCADAASLKNLLGELVRGYAFRLGIEIGENREPAQYADLSEWQNELRESAETEAGRVHWQAWETQAIKNLKLPYESQSTEQIGFDPRDLTIDIPNDVTSKLRVLALQFDSSLSECLLACWQLLLWRLTGQMEVVVGAEFDGRRFRELENALGPFARCLPVKCRFEGEAKFGDVFRQTIEGARQAHKAQEYFSWQHFARAEGGTERCLFFPFSYDFRQYPLCFSAGEVAFSLYKQSTYIDQFKLRLSCVDADGALTAEFHYDPRLFSGEDIARLAEQFLTLLNSVATEKDTEAATLGILPEGQRRHLLAEFNKTRVAYPEGQPLQALFEAQADRTPDAMAVVFEDEWLTYAELNSRANQIGHFLGRLGIGPDQRVGICLERSVEMILAMFGILKAGAAYVPIDPSYPADRIAFVLEDAGAPLLLTQQRSLSVLPAHPGQVLCLDAEWSSIASAPTDIPRLSLSPENACYVIYTSGSTGQPKGVVISHRAITNHMLWFQEAYPLKQQDIVLQKTPCGFDASVWEFFAPLQIGAQLVLARPGGHLDSDYLLTTIATQEVTILQLVPSLLSLILGAPELTRARTLRRVFCGGEALTGRLQEQFFNHIDAELVNLYGPTEATIDTITWVCKKDIGGGDIPIGRPVSNTQVYVLDQNRVPVPVGVGGEIYLAGTCLARGYLKRPGHTAEHFLPLPYSDEPGARMYRTLDLARYTPDGVVRYIDRIDRQVKFRGYRIELAEIESVLRTLDGVRENVVLVREDTPGDKRLTAYLMMEKGRRIAVNHLRAYMKKRLPEYMVPTAFVLVNSFRWTPSGKIDRQALPAPGITRPDLEADYVAPRNEAEKTLAAIWGDVLGLERVGIHDTFFDLGGDSIRSIQVVAVAKAKGLALSIEDLFQYQSIAELAEKIQHNDPLLDQAPRSQPFSLISDEDRRKLPDDVEDAYPLTMLQAGMIYNLELTPDAPTYHNVNSFRLKCRFERDPFEKAVQYAVARHANLRTSFDLTTYSQPLQLVHREAFLPVVLQDLSELPVRRQEECLEVFLQGEFNRLFDLLSPPLMRFHFHRLSVDTVQLTVTECHAIADGWSLTSAMSEIFGYYFALLENGHVSVQAPPPSSFRDYVLLERKAVESPIQRDYWMEKLKDWSFTELPRWEMEQTGRTETGEQSGNWGRRGKVRKHSSRISADIFQEMKTLARVEGVTIKSVLLAAHLKVLSLLSGQARVFSGLVTNGRPEELGGDQLRGLFLNTVPFGVQLSKQTWADLIREVFKAEVEMSPNRRYPLAAMQKQLGGRPLFEVMFNYLNFHSIQDLLSTGDVEVLDSRDLSVTDLAFFVTFYQAPIESPFITLLTEYDITPWTEEYIEAIHGHYHRVIEAMVQSPSDHHDAICLLSEQEQRQLLEEWNSTDRDYGEALSIHRGIELQAGLTPDSLAVMYGEAVLSYGTLNLRANQIAHHLRALGIQPEVPVGICIERGLDMIVAVLGILKSGGTYLPLDPNYPANRTYFILEDSGVQILVTRERLIQKLFAFSGRTVCLDRDWEKIKDGDVSNPEVPMQAENLSHIIYTSGSTGIPKGVAIQHLNVSRFISWAREIFDDAELAGVLASTSICFDLSVFEIFVPLTFGGRVILVDNALQRARISDTEVRLINTVPTVIAELVRMEEVPPLATSVNLAGELLTRELADEIYRVPNIKRLLNLYGPSEDTTYSTGAPVERSSATAPPIGGPITNTQLWLSGPFSDLVPAGAPGEVCLGGEGLARGYINRPEVTAERFIPNPFSVLAGDRMYRTGDVARHRPSGELEYLHRLDHQVKIRGFRIELGEIESLLNEHPGVRESIVMVRGYRRDDRQLVAYLVPAYEPAPKVNEIRAYLREKLPEYMVPPWVFMLDQMPRTPNGKIDRNALPVPEGLRPEMEVVYAPAQTEKERAIAAICQQVLKIDRVGIYDNFFEMGAHSILLLQIHGKLKEVYKMDLPLTDIFQYPTINALAKYLSEEQDKKPTPTTGRDRAEIRKKVARRPERVRKNPGSRN
jgi:amino acid adenylation domain-containing protein